MNKKIQNTDTDLKAEESESLTRDYKQICTSVMEKDKVIVDTNLKAEESEDYKVICASVMEIDEFIVDTDLKAEESESLTRDYKQICTSKVENTTEIAVQFEKCLDNTLTTDKIQHIISAALKRSEGVSFEFVELTHAEKQRIHDALRAPKNQVLISKFNLNITPYDIRTLENSNWVNDIVITFYMNLLKERSERKHESHGLPTVYAMDTFFLPRLLNSGYEAVKRRTLKVNIFSKDIILVPVNNTNDHWSLAVIHFKNCNIQYYDSLGISKPYVLNALVQYLKDESWDKLNKELNTTNFVVKSAQNIPRQKNFNDCGVFTCMFAEYITRNHDFTFTQENMKYFREKMILEILQGELLQ